MAQAQAQALAQSQAQAQAISVVLGHFDSAQASNIPVYADGVVGDLSEPPAVAPAPAAVDGLPRVAICFCGFLSTFRDPDSQDPSTYSQIQKLVEAVGPADVFCSVLDSTDAQGCTEEQRAMRLLSPKRLEIRPPMPGMAEMLALGEHPDIDVLQAAYPMSDPEAAGRQARANGFVFWGIHHAHSLMVKEEREVRDKDYDIVLRMRYDLTFEEFFWTEAGATKHIAYGLRSPPPVGSRVTAHQLTIFQNIDHEFLKVHKMVEYGHLTVRDTVEEVRKFVQGALDSASPVPIVTTPAIHAWGGCNDQFGIATRRAMEVYAGTWDRYHGLINQREIHGVMPGFFETLQTEKCLERALQNDGIGMIRSHKIVARIFRPNGDVSTQ